MYLHWKVMWIIWEEDVPAHLTIVFGIIHYNTDVSYIKHDLHKEGIDCVVGQIYNKCDKSL